MSLCQKYGIILDFSANAKYNAYMTIFEGDLIMLLAIISAAACLAVTTIMYSPRMRSFRHYRPIALFFLFEGIWTAADYAFRQIVPDNVFMEIIHYAGIIVFTIYFILSILFSADKKQSVKKPLPKRSVKEK